MPPGDQSVQQASLSLYTPGSLGLNIDLQLWYHFVHLFWLAASTSLSMWLLRMAAHWICSIVPLFHVIKRWLCIAAQGCALRPLYCSPLPCDKRMATRSGDVICTGLFLCLALLVIPGYKGSGWWDVLFSIPPSLDMSSIPNSLPFSMSNTDSVSDIAEAMEQVRFPLACVWNKLMGVL